MRHWSRGSWGMLPAGRPAASAAEGTADDGDSDPTAPMKEAADRGRRSRPCDGDQAPARAQDGRSAHPPAAGQGPAPARAATTSRKSDPARLPCVERRRAGTNRQESSAVRAGSSMHPARRPTTMPPAHHTRSGARSTGPSRPISSTGARRRPRVLRRGPVVGASPCCRAVPEGLSVAQVSGAPPGRSESRRRRPAASLVATSARISARACPAPAGDRSAGSSVRSIPYGTRSYDRSRWGASGQRVRRPFGAVVQRRRSRSAWRRWATTWRGGAGRRRRRAAGRGAGAVDGAAPGGARPRGDHRPPRAAPSVRPARRAGRRWSTPRTRCGPSLLMAHRRGGGGAVRTVHYIDGPAGPSGVQSGPTRWPGLHLRATFKPSAWSEYRARAVGAPTASTRRGLYPRPPRPGRGGASRLGQLACGPGPRAWPAAQGQPRNARGLRPRLLAAGRGGPACTPVRPRRGDYKEGWRADAERLGLEVGAAPAHGTPAARGG